MKMIQKGLLVTPILNIFSKVMMIMNTFNLTFINKHNYSTSYSFDHRKCVNIFIKAH